MQCVESACRFKPVSVGDSSILRVIDDHTVQDLIKTKLARRVKDTKLVPLPEDFLNYVLNGSRRQDLLSVGVRAARFMLEDRG